MTTTTVPAIAGSPIAGAGCGIGPYPFVASPRGSSSAC